MATATPVQKHLPCSFYRLREGPNSPASRGKQILAPRREQDSEQADEAVRPIQCAQCRFPLTTTQETAFVNSRHRHVFFNPAGLVFDIRCFYQAPGIQVVGTKNSEFSWFSGFLWQVGLCRGCGVHLGWFFTGPGNFHALIADRFIY